MKLIFTNIGVLSAPNNNYGMFHTITNQQIRDLKRYGILYTSASQIEIKNIFCKLTVVASYDGDLSININSVSFVFPTHVTKQTETMTIYLESNLVYTLIALQLTNATVDGHVSISLEANDGQ